MALRREQANQSAGTSFRTIREEPPLTLYGLSPVIDATGGAALSPASVRAVGNSPSSAAVRNSSRSGGTSRPRGGSGSNAIDQDEPDPCQGRTNSAPNAVDRSASFS